MVWPLITSAPVTSTPAPTPTPTPTPTPAPSVQNVSSAMWVGGGNSTSGANPLSNGTNTTMRSRTTAFNETTKSLTELAIILPGWYLDGTSESALPNSYTVTASIEYPANTFNQITWSLATSTSVSPGTNLISDYITLSSAIPISGQFWVRLFVSVTSGQVWCTSNNYGVGNGTVLNSTLGEKGQVGVGLSDTTLGGTITGTSGVLRPAAVISRHTSGYPIVNLGAIGNSISLGVGDNDFDSHNNIGAIGPAATGQCPVLIMGDLGTTAQANAVAGALAYRLDLLTKAGITHVITDYGNNDINAGRTAAQIEGDQATIWAAISGNGQQIIQATLTPRTTTTTNWFDTTNQTPKTGYGGGPTGIRGVVNANIRTKPSPLFDYLEWTNQVETSQDSGIWAVGSGFSTYLQPIDSWTASTGCTTNSLTSNSTQASLYYNNGYVIMTSGVANNSHAFVSSNTTSTFSLSTMLSSAPSSGDTFNASPSGVRTSQDGIHPTRKGGSPTVGSYPILTAYTGTKLAGWL